MYLHHHSVHAFTFSNHNIYLYNIYIVYRGFFILFTVCIKFFLLCSVTLALWRVWAVFTAVRWSSGRTQKGCTSPLGRRGASGLISEDHNSQASDCSLNLRYFALPYRNFSFSCKIIKWEFLDIPIWPWLCHYLFLNSSVPSHSDASSLRLFVDKNSIKVREGTWHNYH